MTPEQFCYWLQGYAEVNGEYPPNIQQWKIIKDHLQTVFNKVTTDYTLPKTLGPITASPKVPVDQYLEKFHQDIRNGEIKAIC